MSTEPRLNIDPELLDDISHTKIHDDINILVNLIDQLQDRLDEAVGVLNDEGIEGYDDDDYVAEAKCIVCQVPRSDTHCKYWTDYSAGELAEALRLKYVNAERMSIPDKYIGSF